MVLHDGNCKANIAPPTPDVGARVNGIKERHHRGKVVLTQFLIKEALHHPHELNRFERLLAKPPIPSVNTVCSKDLVYSIYPAKKRSSPDHEIICGYSRVKRKGKNSICKRPGEGEAASR
jgi:hypothetical protein